MSVTTNPLAALLFILDGNETARWNFVDAIGSPVDNPAGVGNAATVTYSFLQSAPTYYSEPISRFSALNAEEKNAVYDVLASIANMVNLTFLEVNQGGSITYGANEQAGSAGYAFPPGYGYGYSVPGEIISHVTANDAAGDVWLNVDNAWQAVDFLPSHEGFATLIHETAHALGLKHSFESDSGLLLHSDYDNNAYTVMSYQEHPYSQFRTVTQIDSTRYSWTIDTIQPESLMLFDIAALQYLYGANTNYNSGDDIYIFDPQRPFIKTLWDAGGVDTISLANFTLGSKIDLRAGYFSSISTVNPSDPLPSFVKPEDESSFYDGTANLAIAYQVVIENAVGGQGDDTFIGNSVNNQFDGGEGNDRVIYSSRQSDYKVTATALGYSVFNILDGVDEDSLINIESLVFSDQIVSLANITVPTLVTPAAIHYIDTHADDVFAEYSGQLQVDAVNTDVLLYGITGGSLGSELDSEFISKTGVFGVLSLHTLTGQFIYTPNDQAIEAIKNDARDEFIVTVNQGVFSDNAVLNINLSGADDVTEFSGDISGTVSEDNIIVLKGTLRAVDRDDADAILIAQENTLGNYGSFTMAADGAWQYTLNNLSEKVQALNANQTVVDHFVVVTQGGATQQMAIRIEGAEDFKLINGTAKADKLTGSAGADKINGLAGNDTLIGGLGADTLTGGKGNDSYIVSDARAVIVELGEQGVDSVQANVSFTLAVNVENLTLTGSKNISGTGNAQHNTISGNSAANKLSGLAGNDRLSGLAGNDTLLGGVGADTLMGGVGKDTLTGGLGADKFKFMQVNEGLDTITDFDRTQGDKLQFVGVNFATLALGPLASSQFVANNTGLAKTLDHHFIFNTATRILSYDVDGSGSAAAVQIAKLNVSKLIASDFEIVAS